MRAATTTPRSYIRLTCSEIRVRYTAVCQPGAREINVLAFESYGSCETWVEPHFKELRAEVDELMTKIALPKKASFTQDDIKERKELEELIKAVVPSKPMHRVRRVRGAFIQCFELHHVCAPRRLQNRHHLPPRVGEEPFPRPLFL